MELKISSHTNKVGSAVGRFLSSFGYVLTTLIVYLVMCFATYLVLRIGLGLGNGASFIAFEIATGGDPYNFKEIAASRPVLWMWMLALHVLSWLIVPVLAATAVDAAYRRWEARVQELDEALQDELSGILERHVGLPQIEAGQVAEQMLKEAQKKLAIGKRGE